MISKALAIKTITVYIIGHVIIIMGKILPTVMQH